MSECAERLFFRYSPGETGNYSAETLLKIADETMRYAKVLQKHSDKFISFLLDLPDPIFAFYTRRVGFDINGALSFDGVSLGHIFEDERVTERTSQLPSPSFLHNELFQFLNHSLHVTSVKPLPGCSFIVSILKNSNKHNHSDDLLITIEDQELVYYELNHVLKNKAYFEHKESFANELLTFQEKNRLHFLFV